MRKRCQVFFTACFFILLFAPLLEWITGMAPKPVWIGENRSMAEKPVLSALPYEKWASEWSKYISDNMPFRTQFIRKYIQIGDDVLASHVRRFYKSSDREFYPLELLWHYLGFPSLEKEEMFVFKAKMTGMHAFWEERNVPFICVLAPDKSSVYSEYISPLIQQPPVRENWAKQFSRALGATPINFIDMTDILIRHKKEYKTFNKIYDLYHWNGYGLYLAYRTICEALSPQILSFAESKSGEYFEIVSRKIQNLNDDTVLLGEETVPWMYLLNTNSLQVLENEIPTAFPKAHGFAPQVVFNDKKPGGTIACFEDSYFSSTFWSRPLNSNNFIMPWAHYFEYSISVHTSESVFSTTEYIAEKYKPSVVIFEFAERWYFGIVNSKKEQYLKFIQMGEVYLQSPRFVFYPDLANQMTPRGMSITPNGEELILTTRNRASHIELPGAAAGKEGRVVLIGALEAPAAGRARVWYSWGSGEKTEAVPLKQGVNDIYVQLFCQPDALVNVKFFPGDAAGTFKFLPLPALKRIERNLKDEEYLKKRFILDKERLADMYFPISELKTSKDLDAEAARQ
jgi:hypothetical protein